MPEATPLTALPLSAVLRGEVTPPGAVVGPGSAGAPTTPTPAAASSPGASVDSTATAGPIAGEPRWSDVFGATPVGGTPYAVAVDGDTVWLGGDFTGVMAGMPDGTYNRIARWDGRTWHGLGEGLDGTVRSILVVDGDVYAGGDFTVAGGKVAVSRLARWDGAGWAPVGGGVTRTDIPTMASVRALASDGTRLYVAGVFDRVGSGGSAVPASGVAAYTFATGVWEAFGDGLVNVGSPGEGRALALVGDLLYVGGYFDTAGPLQTVSLAAVRLSDGEWTGFGSGIRSGEYTGSVESLAADAGNGDLYVGGSFTLADGVAASGVTRLTGTAFASLGDFLYFGDPSTATVKALALAGGKLYAGGEFTTAGNAAAQRWAVHDGTEWAVPGDGVDNVVNALAAIGDDVVVAGDFQFSGEMRMPHAGIWTGSRWRTFGEGISYDPYADGNAFALVPTPGGVCVGGYFDLAGPETVGSIARWDGTTWDSLGGGLRGVGGLANVYAMARLGDDLYVTGSFATAGAGNAANIARWDGSGWSSLGSGLNDTGFALAELGGRLYVGGRFTAAGGTAASGVAAWDPATGTWSALGNAPVFDDTIFGLVALDDRHLVIGGGYSALRSGGRDLVRGLNGMLMFDVQAEIPADDPLAGYFLVAGVKRSLGTGIVRALRVADGTLFVGGSFDTAGVMDVPTPQGTGISAANLAAWHFAGDGAWTSPGGADQQVQSIALLGDGTLALAGWFTSIGTVGTSGIARLDPRTGEWSGFGDGLGPGGRGVCHGEAVAEGEDGRLFVAGSFLTAGSVPSGNVALWA